MVVTNEEKILAKKGGGILTMTIFFVDLTVCQKIREMKILPKVVKKYTLTTFIAPEMLKILIKCSK